MLAVFWRWVFTSDVPYVRDIALEHFPRAMELRGLVRAGHLPFWNPWEHCGEPVAANPIYLLFYPTAWLGWILPPVYGFKLHYALHFFLLAAGGFLLARRSGLSPFSCWAAGALLVLSGPALSLGNFYNMLPAVAWMPFVILAGDYCARRGGWRGAGLFAAAVAMQVFCFEAATLFASLLLALIWSAGVPPALHMRRLAGGCLLALTLSAAQVFPVLSHLISAPPAARFDYGVASFWALHPLRLLELLVPEIWGNPLTDTSQPWVYLDGREAFLLSAFIGIIPVALALAALITIRRRRVWFWGVAAAFFLLLAMGPLFPVLYRVFPLVRFPAKFLLPVTLAITQLAAAGVDHLLNSGEREARLRWLAGGVLAFGALWLAASFALLLPGAQRLATALAERHFDVAEAQRLLPRLELDRAAIVRRAADWVQLVVARRALYVLLSSMIAAAVLYRPKRAWVIGVVCASVAFLMFTHWSLNPVVSSRFYSDEPPIARLLSGARPLRMFSGPAAPMAMALPPSLRLDPAALGFLPPPAQVLYADRMNVSIRSTALGLENSFANDPEALLPAFQAYLNESVYQQRLKAEDLVSVLQSSSVVYVVMSTAPPAGLEPVGTASNGTARPVTAYRVPGASPRAYRTQGSATILRRDPMRVEVETAGAQPGWLILTDSYDPDWRVTVDGKPARLERANQMFRGVPVPAGAHFVVFRFVPVALYVGIVVTLASAALAIFMAIRAWKLFRTAAE